MSISVAPAATASRTSCSLVASDARPDGNAVATLATCDADAAQRVDRGRDEVGVDADRGDRRAPRRRDGSGRIALAHSERTLPGVSAPSSVVRSTIEIAVSIAHALAVVLMLRVASAGRAALGADLVDAGQPVQEPPQRRLVAGRLPQGRDVTAERARERDAHRLSVRTTGIPRPGVYLHAGFVLGVSINSGHRRGART